jgi:N-hydroxyarylamine O-acetyltransferase
MVISYSSRYLDRIAYTGPTEPTAETLRLLHRAHLFAVPFENLDIALGRKIVCDEDSFLSKIVECRRGGFCYELNGAFAVLLRELGFAVTLLSARVPRDDGSYSPEFDHLALRVNLEEPWLADVGFGDLCLDPLRLATGAEQEQEGWKFRVVSESDSQHVERMERMKRTERLERSDGWKRQYSLTRTPRRLDEFADMCHYHQTSPESSFTRKRVCSRATTDGRITLSDRTLIITRNGARNGEREERLLSSEAEWQIALREHFGVVL